MNNQRSVDEATLQMIVQRSFDAQQATEKLIKAHREHAGSDVAERRRLWNINGSSRATRKSVAGSR